MLAPPPPPQQVKGQLSETSPHERPAPPGRSSDTHPGLLEAVRPPAVLGVLGQRLGLLELLAQTLYPLVVARG